MISLLASAAIGIFVLASNIKSRLHHIYGILTFAIIGLSLSNILSLNTDLDQLLFVRLVMVASTIGIFSLYLFIRKIRGASLRSGLVVILGCFTFLAAIIDMTPLVFSGVEVDIPPRPIFQEGIYLYAAQFLITGFITVAEMVRGLRGANPQQRMQYRYLMVGLVPILIGAPITGFILPLFFQHTSLIIVSPLYGLFFVACVGYAIIRHGLFDIRLALSRTLAYALTLGLLAVLYVAMVSLMSGWLLPSGVQQSLGISSVLPVLLLVLIFQPVKKFFDRITHSIFFYGRYSRDDFYAELSSTLTQTSNLRNLLFDASQVIERNFSAEQVFFSLDYHGRMTTVGTEGHRRISKDDFEQLQKWWRRSDQSEPPVIYLDSLERHGDAREIRQIMTGSRAVMVVPLSRDDQILGVLVIGERKSGTYIKRDLAILETVADELVISIQNALSIREIQSLNESLQQRIDDATKELRESNEKLQRLDAAKDEFVSMASHQLRTPLTSVKGYISMVLEGDAGDITEMQSKLLGEAFTSSERMVHLINDFLNVSRLQTGKFMIDRRKVDLSKVVAQEVQSLQSTAQAHDITLKYRQPNLFPMLYLDEGKLRQVIMNFIDNAFYYSREFSTVTVKVAAVGPEVVVTVTDTGMGVPASEQKRLFTKFFRATNARKQRPDGTGVGLFLAKKVVLAHGGSMIFESEEGKGSTFGFRLPIKRLANAPADGADELAQ